jgi:hypothetical protein
MADDDSIRGSDIDREQGVEFGALADELASHDYPATTDELLDAYGDHELDLPGGSETFAAVLGTQTTEQRFESSEAVRQTVFNMVSADAVGRRGYSDRAGARPDPGDGTGGADDSI